MITGGWSQSLQEIGIGLEVLHDVSLPRKHKILGEDDDDEADERDLSDERGKEEEGGVTIDERADEPLKSDNEGTELARMRLLCRSLRAKLTPVDKRSGTGLLF